MIGISSVCLNAFNRPQYVSFAGLAFRRPPKTSVRLGAETVVAIDSYEGGKCRGRLLDKSADSTIPPVVLQRFELEPNTPFRLNREGTNIIFRPRNKKGKSTPFTLEFDAPADVPVHREEVFRAVVASTKLNIDLLPARKFAKWYEAPPEGDMA